MSDLIIEKKRAAARANNPKLESIINTYFVETKDQEFLDYMQDMIDGYMMHECKLGRITGPRKEQQDVV